VFDVSIDKKIIVLTVPEGNNKPYYAPAGFYMRIGALSQKMDRDSIVEMCQDEGLSRYDTIVRKDLPIDNRFNDVAFKRYLRAANISDVLDKETTLQNLDCAKLSGDKLCYTNAGALFFRDNTEDGNYSHAEIVCALYKGVEKVDILDAKRFDGDIISNIDDAVVFLKKHLRVRYEIKTVQRKDILELPEDALREAVINAVCHRNYFQTGARVMVEIFDDRVDITNPGGVPKGITPENFGTLSITRNDVIAKMLHRIKYIEEMGTGIKRMRNATKELDVAAPEFELNNFFKVTFKRTLLHTDIPSDSQSPPIAAQSAISDTQAILSDTKRYSNDCKQLQAFKTDTRVSLSDRKTTIISWLEENKKATSSELARFLGVSNVWARKILRSMASDGVIEKVGDDRDTYYTLKSPK
jgi:ATP-dependent DNA helicase RecG